MNLKNKTIVITGASDGIGREIALSLAKEGVNLVLIGRNEERLDSVLTQVKSLGAENSRSYTLDIRNYEQTKDVISQIISDFGSINVLINNAGVWHKPQNLELIGEEKALEVIETNLFGLIRITAMLLPNLKIQKEAAIINISSRSGVTAQLGQTVYGASKWGVTGFTENLKVELKGTNVRVAGVYQGKTATKMFEKANDDIDVSHGTDPKDLADVILFMLSRPPKTWLHDVRVEY